MELSQEQKDQLSILLDRMHSAIQMFLRGIAQELPFVGDDKAAFQWAKDQLYQGAEHMLYDGQTVSMPVLRGYLLARLALNGRSVDRVMAELDAEFLKRTLAKMEEVDKQRKDYKSVDAAQETGVVPSTVPPRPFYPQHKGDLTMPATDIQHIAAAIGRASARHGFTKTDPYLAGGEGRDALMLISRDVATALGLPVPAMLYVAPKPDEDEGDTEDGEKPVPDKA